MKFFTHLVYLLFLLVFMLGVTLPVSADISKRKAVKKFIAEMAKEDGFDKNELTKIFKQVKIKKKIIEAMNRPAEGVLTWHKYRAIFLKKNRIQGGVKFWQKNEKDLNRASEKYGVPAEIIVAIIGVETKYGKHKGKYRVIDAISTLAFDYPKRSKFFRKELKEFLFLTKEENIDPLTLLGSYAGAMGKPQFIASSYRHYAVDFDGDGKRDLLNNTTDVIGSVANYFKRHHWRKGEPVTVRASVKGKSYKKIVKKGIKPSLTVKALAKKGIKTKAKIDPQEKAALIELEIKKGKEYWLGLNNFYVISRYNHSELYSMAVYQLSQAIVKARNKALAKMAKSSVAKTGNPKSTLAQ